MICTFANELEKPKYHLAQAGFVHTSLIIHEIRILPKGFYLGKSYVLCKEVVCLSLIKDKFVIHVAA